MEMSKLGKRQRHKEEYRAYADRLVACELEDPNSRLTKVLAHDEQIIAASAPLARLWIGEEFVVGKSDGSRFDAIKYGVPMKGLVIPVALPVDHVPDLGAQVSAHNLTQLVLFEYGKSEYVATIYGITAHHAAATKYQTITGMNNCLNTSEGPQ